MHGLCLTKNIFEILDVQHRIGIGHRAVGFIVYFHEQGVDTAGYGGPDQVGNEFSLPAGDVPHGSRQLDGMCRIKTHGVARLPHDGQTPHVIDQHVVSQKGPPVRQQYLTIAVCLDLSDGVLHIPGTHELAFFQMNGPLRVRRRAKYGSLPAKVCGNLHHITYLAGGRPPSGVREIGHDRNAEFPAHIGECPQPIVQPESMEAVRGGAAVLVVAGLVNPGDPYAPTDPADQLGHFERVLPAFKSAGSADENQWETVANPYL